MIFNRSKCLLVPLIPMILVIPLMAGRALGADLRITDSANVTAIVRDALIDYGAFTSDKETLGIRVNQGDATVFAQWSNIVTLTITGKEQGDPSAAPRIKVEIALKDGTKLAASLIHKGRMMLSGKTDLGDYSIDLEKIRTIVPVPPK